MKCASPYLLPLHRPFYPKRGISEAEGPSPHYLTDLPRPKVSPPRFRRLYSEGSPSPTRPFPRTLKVLTSFDPPLFLCKNGFCSHFLSFLELSPLRLDRLGFVDGVLPPSYKDFSRSRLIFFSSEEGSAVPGGAPPFSLREGNFFPVPFQLLRPPPLHTGMSRGHGWPPFFSGVPL